MEYMPAIFSSLLLLTTTMGSMIISHIFSNRELKGMTTFFSMCRCIHSTMKKIIMKYQMYAAKPRIVCSELCRRPEKMAESRTEDGERGGESKWYLSLAR